MTIREISKRYNELAKINRFDLIQEELYSEDCESIEPIHSSLLKSVKGKDAIKIKGLEFGKKILEVHSSYSGSPSIAGQYFSLEMGMDITMIDGTRLELDEICVFHVKDQKIVCEQFFY
jgi:hypothetical protein